MRLLDKIFGRPNVYNQMSAMIKREKLKAQRRAAAMDQIQAHGDMIKQPRDLFSDALWEGRREKFDNGGMSL